VLVQQFDDLGQLGEIGTQMLEPVDHDYMDHAFLDMLKQSAQ